MKPSSIRVGILSLLLLLPLLTGCRPNPPTSPPPSLPDSTPQPAASAPPAPAEVPANTAAVVNGQAIPKAVFEAQTQAAFEAYQQHTNTGDEAAEQAVRSQVLSLLIDQILVDQAAAREGVTVDDAQIDADFERARAQDPDGFADWLAANGFTEDTFRAQIRANLLASAMRERVSKEVSGAVEQVHLRQIVLASEAQAREILAQVQGSATFEELANEHSLDQAGHVNGGDIGFVPRGVLGQSLEEVAFSLQPGQIAGPIQCRSGWYVIKLVERDPSREIPPEMLIALQQEMYGRWLQEQRARAEIITFVP